MTLVMCHVSCVASVVAARRGKSRGRLCEEPRIGRDLKAGGSVAQNLNRPRRRDKPIRQVTDVARIR
jgi:hypothetical protein